MVSRAIKSAPLSNYFYLEVSMKYILKRTSPFGTFLDEDGRTVLGKSITVDAGSVVELLSVGAWDLMLVKYTNVWGLTVFGWVFINDLEEVVEYQVGMKVRILRDITRGDLFDTINQQVIYHEGDVCKVDAVSPVENDEWPIAALLPDESDYWYLKAEWFEKV